MTNIIKAQLYKFTHSTFILLMTICLMLIGVLISLFNLEEGTATMLMANHTIPFSMVVLFIGVYIASFCAEDNKDKTINYELMEGKSRLESFLARSLLAVIITAVVMTIATFVPLVVGLIKCGWDGNVSLSATINGNVSLRDEVIRTMLSFFPYLRISAFIVMIAYICKHNIAIIASGFFYQTGMLMVIELVKDHSNLYLGTYNLNMLFECKTNVTSSGYTIDNSLSATLVVGTILVSIIMTAFYLFAGYALFRREDMN